MTDSFWLRERATLVLPPLVGVRQLEIVGEVRPADPADRTARGNVGLDLRLDGRLVAGAPHLPAGPFRLTCPIPPGQPMGKMGHRLGLTLRGVRGSNFLAWLGRVSGRAAWQSWRRQARNRRLRIQRIEADGEVLFDFSNRACPWNTAYARRFLQLGLNLVGYFRADLGIAESVRCAARAADAAALPVSLVELRLPCKNPMGDDSYAPRLQQDNPHPVNVIHVDAPGMRDLDHHHGTAFRAGKYTIGYWAWELPDFPDAWIEYSDYCQEVWTPSRFSAEAIAEKIPIPVLVMPHAISFARPTGDYRDKFGLPRDRYLFLFMYDLNSYSVRKNPAAVLEAYRRSGLAGAGAGLVIKVHNVAGNEADFSRLQEAASALPHTTVLARTFSRQEIYELESACDCFVSLHRSEGFGLAPAECMYLGKPVIATDWSATTEFINSSNGCPVRAQLVALERNHGPYAKGQRWADPDIDHAAWWMRQLAQDQALGARLGAAAQATIEEQFSPAKIGARYRRRLESIALW